MVNYKEFLKLHEQELAEKTGIAVNSVMKDFEIDGALRTNILGTINSNSNYSSVFNAIKNYWAKQIPLLKGKPKDQLTSDESNMLETIEKNFKNGTSQEIEKYAVRKVLSGHSDEFTYDEKSKKLSITGQYKETQYDKDIKSK